MARLFISVAKLESLTAANKVQIAGDRMDLVDLRRTFKIQPAVHFIAVEGADSDPHDLVGLVKTDEDLVTMGADQMGSSVIYVDTAYKVQQGFLGDPQAA